MPKTSAALDTVLMHLDPPHHPVPPISILMYHQVGEFSSPDSHRACFCHIKRFKAQMAWLHFAGYRVVGLEEVYSMLWDRGQQLKASAGIVALTFDDGYQNFYRYAWPVLARYHFPATVFMVAGKIGKTADWLENRGATPLMNLKELKEIAKQGITIGAHSLTHPKLDGIPLQQAEEEVKASKAKLEDLLGKPVDFFAYPYGRYTPEIRDVVAQAGHKMALTCIRGAANTAENPFEVPRKAISYGDSLAGFVWKLHLKHRRKS